jgi:hypothetical protein
MNVSESVRSYVKNRPYISEALEKGIVNISELSRILQKDLQINSITAIKAALRRHSLRLMSNKQKREEAVLSLLRVCKLMVLDNLSIIVTDKNHDIPNKMKIKLTDLHYVYVIEMNELGLIERKVKKNICKVHEYCTALIISSPEIIEERPGIVSYLTSLLSSQNISSLAFTCCHTETTIVVRRKDAIKSYEILSNVIGSRSKN